MVFVLSGEVRIFSGGTYRDLPAGSMTLVSAGDGFYGEARTDFLLVYCSFSRDMPLCNKFALESLSAFLPRSGAPAGMGGAVLPVRPLLSRYLQVAVDVLRIRMLCAHYQRITVETVFLLLRGFDRGPDHLVVRDVEHGCGNPPPARLLEHFPERNECHGSSPSDFVLNRLVFRL